MNRRRFFRLLAGAAAWAQTKHLTWAFPEPVHVIPQRMMYARIRISADVIRASKFAQPGTVFQECARAEYAGLIRDMQHQEELMILKNRVS